MSYDPNIVSEIVNRVMAEISGGAPKEASLVPVGVSNRHIHLNTFYITT